MINPYQSPLSDYSPPSDEDDVKWWHLLWVLSLDVILVFNSYLIITGRDTAWAWIGFVCGTIVAVCLTYDHKGYFKNLESMFTRDYWRFS